MPMGWTVSANVLSESFLPFIIFNLRGIVVQVENSGGKEGDGIFGLGSRTPIAITILVKKGE